MRPRHESLTILHGFLTEHGHELVVAESLTAGLVQATIASRSGCSAYFRGGVTAYTLEDKVRLLRVDKATAEVCDCVSPEVAGQMARGALMLFDGFQKSGQVKWALATTGYADPDPSKGIAQYAEIALARSTGQAGTLVLARVCVTLDAPLSRDEFRNVVADQALDLLVQFLKR